MASITTNQLPVQTGGSECAGSISVDENFETGDVRDQATVDLTRPVAIYESGYAIINGDTVYGVARNVVMVRPPVKQVLLWHQSQPAEGTDER